MQTDVERPVRWLSAVTMTGAITAAIVSMLPSGIPAAGFAVLLLLVPVYLATWPLFAPRLGAAAALAVGGALGVGAAIIGGFVLNLVPGGLGRTNWLFYVLALSVAALVTRFLVGGRFTPPRIRLPSTEAVLITFGLLLLTVGYLVSRASAPFPAVHFTELAIRPSATEPATIEVMVRSHESEDIAYRLEIRRDSVLIASFDPIRLAPTETWRTTVEAGVGSIQAALVNRDADEVPYRMVTLVTPDQSGP